VRYVISASVLTLAIAILICVLIPRYYLLVAFPEKPMVEMGPFATRAGCESARQRMPDAIVGGHLVDGKDRDALSKFMVCVSSR
jgi:hypothetical protein